MSAAQGPTAADGPPVVGWAEATATWGRIAALSFGGPAGQIAVMHRILVEEKRWIGEARFLHALNFCMLLPGPEAQQLATYVGWLLHGTRGGLLAGGLFVLPGVLSIMALSWIYVLWGQVGVVAGAFYGLKAAVLAIVLYAAVRIGRRAIRGRTATGIAAAAFVAIGAFDVPFPAVVLVAAVVGWCAGRTGNLATGGGHGSGHGGRGPSVDDAETLLGERLPAHATPAAGRPLRTAAVWLPLWLGPVALLVLVRGSDDVFATIGWFFSGTVVVTFGGAYAVLGHVAQQAVDRFGWLALAEMMDGLAMAETTPGPLIMVLQFVGFLAAFRDPGGLPPLLAGTLGGLLATWVTFAPCFLWIFLGAPFVERMRGNRALAAALAAITAAVVGVILDLALWFAMHALFGRTTVLDAGPLRLEVPVLSTVDPWALALAVLAGLALFRFRVGTLGVVAGSALAGVALRTVGAAP